MQRRKSLRHQRAANARWRQAEHRAQAERAAGIHDRTDADFRMPCTLDLRGAGGPLVTFEPRMGYASWRRIESGKATDCAAIKTLLHREAGKLARMLSPARAALSHAALDRMAADAQRLGLDY